MAQQSAGRYSSDGVPGAWLSVWRVTMLVALLGLLAACGQSGDLYLPEEEQAEESS